MNHSTLGLRVIKKRARTRGVENRRRPGIYPPTLDGQHAGKRFGGGLLFKAHRLLYHSTLGLLGVRAIKKKRRPKCFTSEVGIEQNRSGFSPGIAKLDSANGGYQFQFKNNHFTEMCCGTEAGSYLRLIDSCITQLQAQGPSRTCTESKEAANGGYPVG